MSETLPKWIEEQIREQQVAMGMRKQWGGKRPGAGRPKQYNRLTIVVKFNRIQRLNLEEMADGDVQKAVQMLIDKYV
jgi:hypothetical protein